MSAPLPCPECEQRDAVRKISSMYRQEDETHHRDNVQHNEIAIDTIEATRGSSIPLQELFKPPVKPQASENVIELFFFRIITVLLIVILVIMAIVAFLTNQWLVYIIIAVGLLAGDIIAWTLLNKYVFRAKIEKAGQEIEERWQQARPDQRWENIYFCKRCYGVYLNDPEFELPLLPPELVHLLYWWPDIDLEAIRQTAASDGPEVAVYDYIEQTYTPPSIARPALAYLAKHDYQLEEVSTD